jgi:hypothetical protein
MNLSGIYGVHMDIKGQGRVSPREEPRPHHPVHANHLVRAHSDIASCSPIPKHVRCTNGTVDLHAPIFGKYGDHLPRYDPRVMI